MNSFIPCFRPLIEAEEKAAAVSALDLGWLGMGSFVQEFENAIREELDITDREVVAVNTGHSAIHLGMILANVGPGDEVITPSFNNASDLQAIRGVGADIVFCDVDPQTLCIDISKAEAMITPRTRMIIGMDYALHICDHAALAALAEAHGLRVLHDAAHSFGSTYQGQPVGSFSDMTMFSFDPIKNITCIDAGILIVKSAEERDQLHSMRLLGMTQEISTLYSNKRVSNYDIKGPGFRYHLSNSHAAIGLAQLAKFPRIKENRKSYCRLYERELAGIDALRLPNGDYDEVTPFLFYVRVPEARRDAFRAHLASLQIETGLHWQPGHTYTSFAQSRCDDLAVTNKIGVELVTLPLHSDMSPQTLERVTDAVRSFFK